MLLSQRNPHVRDARIQFFEEGHKYVIDGVDGKPTSTTTLIHHHFPKFDADAIIDKMTQSWKWSQSKYFGMTKDAIKKKWSDDGAEAAALGTKMHKSIEDYFNEETVSEEVRETKEFKMFLNFWQDFTTKLPFKVTPYRTEWSVFDELKLVSGNIDFTVEDPQGNIIIIDWKRSKEIKKSNRWQKGLKMMSHLDDCNYNHYCLQLNVYRHILETLYDKRVIGMYLVVLHPNQENYQFIHVPPMPQEIQNLWDSLPYQPEEEEHQLIVPTLESQQEVPSQVVPPTNKIVVPPVEVQVPNEITIPFIVPPVQTVPKRNSITVKKVKCQPETNDIPVIPTIVVPTITDQNNWVGSAPVEPVFLQQFNNMTI